MTFRQIAALVAHLPAAGILGAGIAAAGDGPAWDPTCVAWRIEGEDGVIRADARGKSFCVASCAPSSASGSVEARIRLARTAGDGRKAAGVAWRADDENYWHLVLAREPEHDGGRHHVELGQALAGARPAQNDGTTKPAPDPIGMAWIDWRWDTGYRLEIRVESDRVSGTVADADGRLLARLGYRLDGRSASCGRPALVADGFDARFEAVRFTAGDPCEIPPRVPLAYSVQPSAIPEVRADASGFFAVTPLHGVWWLIDPRGNGFLSIATDHVHPDGRGCTAPDCVPCAHDIPERYRADPAAWSEATVDRLRRWGFTALGVNSARTVRHRGLPHTVDIAVGTEFAGYAAIVPQGPGAGFPDVFDPRWPDHCRMTSRRHGELHRHDPWFLGYFLDNELDWFGRSSRPTGLADAVWRLPAGAPARGALLALIQERYADAAALNAAWETGFGSLGEAAEATEPPPDTAASLADRQAFVRLAADRYFGVACGALREADPNHLILGCRFGFDAPGVWDIAGRDCDVISINVYPAVDLDRGMAEGLEERLERAHRDSRRPLMITGWGFPALDSGLSCTAGAGQRFDTQEQRARAFEIVQTVLLRLPFVVGSHFFLWTDAPAEGIPPGFGKSANYGRVDERDDPCEQLVAAAARVHAQAAHIHRTGTHPPLALPAQRRASLLPQSGAPWMRRPDAEPRVVRTGAALTVDNGVLRLKREAASGNAFDTVAIEGAVLGRFAPLLRQRLDQDARVFPDRVDPDSIVIATRPDGSTVVDMTFVRERGGPVTGKTDLEGRLEPGIEAPRAYRARFRFSIPAGRPWFDVRCLWIENADVDPWHLVALHHFAEPSLGGNPAGDAPMPLPPGYYLPAAVWTDPAEGLCYGVALADPRDYDLTFRIDPEGGGYPGAAFPCNATLDPGVRIFPGDPGLRVFGTRESGGSAHWKAVAWEATRQRVPAPVRIPGDTWRDRLRGGWAGQMIGVTIGAPYEFQSLGRIIEGDLEPFRPDALAGALAQDDLYLELAFLDLLQRYGLDIRSDDAARAWSETTYRLWHGNLAARQNLLRGIRPPMSGSPVCSEHWQDIDFQIEADIFGLLHPGMPAAARDVASRFGVVLASGDGLYGGLFVADLYARAYVETNRASLVRNALAGIPAESDYARAVGDVLDAYDADPLDWRRAWHILQERWSDKDVCPSGRGKPFNISATLNGAYAVIGFLYGEGDLWKTAEIATRCGQDADCNASTACGVLGTMLGFSNLPPEAAGAFADLTGIPFEHSSLDFEGTVAACETLVVGAVERAGGRVDGDDLLVP